MSGSAQHKHSNVNVRLNVRLEAVDYNGPFELLFALIDKNEIDIYDIPISVLTEQYLEYINSMEDMSEFILMAAMLLEIKSKMLVPAVKEKLTDNPEEDPREELVQKLIEYRRFKEITTVLNDRSTDASKIFFKPAEPLREDLLTAVTDRYDEVKELLKSVTPEGLYAVFNEIMNRRELRTDMIRSGFDSVAKDSFTLDGKISYISGLLAVRKRLLFADVINGCSSKIEKVVTFLAVLELIRQLKVTVEQENIFEEICIMSKDAETS